MCSLINKQLLLTAYAYLFIMEQQKDQQGSEALQMRNCCTKNPKRDGQRIEQNESSRPMEMQKQGLKQKNIVSNEKQKPPINGKNFKEDAMRVVDLEKRSRNRDLVFLPSGTVGEVDMGVPQEPPTKKPSFLPAGRKPDESKEIRAFRAFLEDDWSFRIRQSLWEEFNEMAKSKMTLTQIAQRAQCYRLRVVEFQTKRVVDLEQRSRNRAQQEGVELEDLVFLPSGKVGEEPLTRGKPSSLSAGTKKPGETKEIRAFRAFLEEDWFFSIQKPLMLEFNDMAKSKKTLEEIAQKFCINALRVKQFRDEYEDAGRAQAPGSASTRGRAAQAGGQTGPQGERKQGQRSLSGTSSSGSVPEDSFITPPNNPGPGKMKAPSNRGALSGGGEAGPSKSK